MKWNMKNMPIKIGQKLLSCKRRSGHVEERPEETAGASSEQSECLWGLLPEHEGQREGAGGRLD